MKREEEIYNAMRDLGIGAYKDDGSLGHGVMVAQKILVLLDMVRVRVRQRKIFKLIS